jgi:hypothetical protein
MLALLTERNFRQEHDRFEGAVSPLSQRDQRRDVNAV